MTLLMKCVIDWRKFPLIWCDMMTLRRPTTLSRPMNCLRLAVNVIEHALLLTQKTLIKLDFSLFPTVLYYDVGDI